MNDRPFFLDSNVVIYALGNNTDKKRIATNLIKLRPIISIQVINETLNVSLRKLQLSIEDVGMMFTLLKRQCDIKTIGTKTVETALELLQEYKFSYYDSLILAAALENGSARLYSENFQNRQVIKHLGSSLEIVNPFSE
jgi:predicted nucleic acid-binding protein